MYKSNIFLRAASCKQYCTTKLPTVKLICDNPKAKAQQQIEIKVI